MSPKDQIKAEVRRFEAAQGVADAGMALFGTMSLMAHKLPPSVARHLPTLQIALEKWVEASEADEPEIEGTRS